MMGRWRFIPVLLIVSKLGWASFFPGSGPATTSSKANKPLRDYDKAARTLQRFESQMAAVVQERGGHLRVIAETSDQRINATATRAGDDWNIIVYGGLLQHPSLSEAEITLILCHELGHHLGGTPTAARGGWSACEGQADYWSARECFLSLHPLEDAPSIALRLTEIYARMGGAPPPRLDCREETRVIRTYFGYPSPQCRLDTLLAGFQNDTRPACWFIPQ